MKLLKQKSKALFVDLDETKIFLSGTSIRVSRLMLQGKKTNRTGGYREEWQKPEVFASLLD
ncbi:hypothetical protein SAMN05421890_3404 [Ensifer adhaerens]|nr:hypothetical protein SAMN05421890_3404 [Ensifer adhaerens]